MKNLRARDLNVLLVDDNASDRAIEKSMLTEFGFKKIHESEDGAQALFKLNNMAFDLVISDLKMPNVDGLGFLKALKNKKSLSQVPVIFLSGMTIPEDIKEAAELGVKEYVVKPVKKDVLFEKLKKIFPDAELGKVADPNVKKNA